jgi:signal transduction histidine kinase
MNVRSLRLRLLLFGVISIVLALVLSAVGMIFLFERHVARRVDAELTVHLNQLVAGLDKDEAGAIALVNPLAEPRFLRPLSGLYWQVLIESTGVMLRSRSLWDAELTLPGGSPTGSDVRQHRLPGPGGAMLHVLERRFELPERLEGVTVRAAVALDVAEIAQAVRSFVADLLPFLVVIAALLIVAAWVQVTLGLRPLALIRERLAAIRSGAEQRLGSGFPDEVKPLAVEIDGLLDARDLQVNRARARVADLAHGLKTPLQVLAGDAERLDKMGEPEMARELTALVSAMHRHVERELTRTRLGAGTLQASADVREVADRVVNVVRRTPAGRKLTWSVDVPGALLARVDPDDLAEAFGNLIENAAHHAQTRVAVWGARMDDHVVVRITDDGPGIAAEHIGQALARGGRLDSGGSGAGLGLAIVSDIAEAWGASFSIENAAPGLRASLTLRIA